MPTYVYKFIDTGETIEVQQAFTDDALTHAEHPATREQLQVKKVFTPVGVTFKGGGFYKTDSRNGKAKSSSSTPTSTESSSSSSNGSSGGSSGDSSGDSSSTSATPAAPAPASTPAPTKTASTAD